MPLPPRILPLVVLVRTALPTAVWQANVSDLGGLVWRSPGSRGGQAWSWVRLTRPGDGGEEVVDAEPTDRDRCGPQVVRLSAAGVAALEHHVAIDWAAFGRLHLQRDPAEVPGPAPSPVDRRGRPKAPFTLASESAPARVAIDVSAGSEAAIQAWLTRWQVEWPESQVGGIQVHRPWAATDWKTLDEGFSVRVVCARAAVTTVRSAAWRAFEWRWLWAWLPEDAWPLGSLSR